MKAEANDRKVYKRKSSIIAIPNKGMKQIGYLRHFVA